MLRACLKLQIPAHRVLFCSTLEGKTSIVRQLEPDLHVDGHPHTVLPHSECQSAKCISSILPVKGRAVCRYAFSVYWSQDLRGD